MFSLNTLATDPLLFVVGFLALAVSIGVHEFAHVLSAYLQGDLTGKLMGRLTLNPIKHLDPIGTVAIVLAGIGWGKPAPYNPFNLRSRRWGPLLVALGGPVSNLIMVLLAGYALLIIGPNLPVTNLLIRFLATLVVLNAALAVFNLLPITPLDGSHIIEAILPPNHPLVAWLQRYGMFLLIGLLLVGGGLLQSYLFGGVKIILTIFGLRSLI